MNYKLIPACREHITQIAALERLCFLPPWSENMLAEELYQPTASLIVAEGEDGTVLSYGLVRTVLDEGYLEKIAVLPAYRRQGVAEEILRSYLRFGREHLAFLTLEVRAGNEAAIALYRKLGFAEAGRREGYYTAPKEDALLMTLDFRQDV